MHFKYSINCIRSTSAKTSNQWLCHVANKIKIQPRNQSKCCSAPLRTVCITRQCHHGNKRTLEAWQIKSLKFKIRCHTSYLKYPWMMLINKLASCLCFLHTGLQGIGGNWGQVQHEDIKELGTTAERMLEKWKKTVCAAKWSLSHFNYTARFNQHGIGQPRLRTSLENKPKQKQLINRI